MLEFAIALVGSSLGACRAMCARKRAARNSWDSLIDRLNFFHLLEEGPSRPRLPTERALLVRSGAARHISKRSFHADELSLASS